ncbi:hypothetical protein [Bradyrhizobium betae]|uniref:Uncharacterized protein n=1 Tax=Bradyrhizobium betae TaxID=244734 RepID=A0A5P6NZL1_9BRAD|nr:hypothetical protein [Bradyrhizobium betae]MCS3725292.1 hypothetical protein [Bradyrhizobium betae]QFI71385.1 hypothetical protein F8237_02805 [Bradyrhizobium betae]
MPTASSVLTSRFRDIFTRIGAAFRAQREIDARRALQRYRELLEQPPETSRSSEMIPDAIEEDSSRDANRVDPRERAAGQSTFERA